ncbi:MAG: DUF192 domain-containing protein [Microgenomates group bacterium]
MRSIKFLTFTVFPAIIIILVFLNLFVKKKNKNYINYKINGKVYKLLIADEEKEWIKGLMDIKKKQDFDGMIFIFPDKNYRQFWNKNTYLDLDIYWLNDDQVVGKDFLPSIEKSKNIVIVNSPKKINKVVEIIKAHP